MTSPCPCFASPRPQAQHKLQPLYVTTFLSRKLERGLGYNLLSRFHFCLVICQAEASCLGLSPPTGSRVMHPEIPSPSQTVLDSYFFRGLCLCIHSIMGQGG